MSSEHNCCIDECNNQIAYRTYKMCDKHGRRMKRHGDPNTVKRINRYEPIGICLTCGTECKLAFCSAKCKDKASRIYKTYGITIKQYREMLECQLKLCGICRKFMDPPFIDHNHETGKVRQLLCRSCNLLIGQANEDPWTLQRAANYLYEYNQGKVFPSPEMISTIEILSW